jgi:4-amino-4-deoxy-L-arabinose transferase-like glycosyltransferase
MIDHVAVREPRVAPGHATVRPWAARWMLLALLGVGLGTRLWTLDADPPAWMQGAFISDEGWWADCARGKLFFNNYFSDDFGTAYLVTPAYTWALEAIYRLAGVGTAQTRALAALATLAAILALAGALWREAGWRAALIAALMLTLSPFYWAYGRIGLQEPFQGMAIAAAFACWTGARRHGAWALAAGAAMGLAIAIKPNAVTLGLAPMALAVAGSYMVERTERSPAAGRPGLLREYALQTGLAGLGLALVLGAVFFAHALPHWAAFKALVLAESGSETSTWKERLTMPGMLLISTELRKTINTPIFWTPAVTSPALMTIFWLCALGLVLRLRGGWTRLLRATTPLEAAALGWALGTLAVIGSEFYQPDRRYVLAIPPLATVCALFLGRIRQNAAAVRAAEAPGRRGWLYAFVLWSVLSLPLLVLLKPPLTRLIMLLGARVPLGRDVGLDFAAAGTLMTMGWVALLGGLALRWRRPAERFARALFDRQAILSLAAVLLALEAAVIGINLAGTQATMSELQGRLGRELRAGETVLGHVSTTLLMPLKVRTVRRVSKFEFTPPPNPDVWARLKPRYIIEMTQRNYQPAVPLYDDLVRQGGYRSVGHYGIGPFKDGVARFEFELWERPAPPGGK